MRLKSYLFIALAITSLYSCSDDNDDNASGNSENSITVTFPLNDGNYWNYDVLTDGTPSRDSIFITHDTIINSITYKKVETEIIPTGFYSSSLKNNALRIDNEKLLLTGDLSFLAGQSLPVGVDLSVTDFTILDNNAVSGTELSSKTGTISQTINSLPVTMDYTLKTVAGADYTSLTINNVTYQNVKTTDVILTASAYLTIIPGYNQDILNPSNQDVMVSEILFADGIGAIAITTDINFTLDATIASSLNIPQAQSQHQEETLDTYHIN